MLRHGRFKRDMATTDKDNSSTMVESETSSSKSKHVNGMTSFKLESPAGLLSYIPSNPLNYNDFIRVVIQMTLAFNSEEIDHALKRRVLKALNSSSGEFESDEDDDLDEDERAFYQACRDAEMIEAQEGSQKIEETSKLLNNLPKTEKLSLKILSFDEADSDKISKILVEYAGFADDKAVEILNKHKVITLPHEEATQLYTKLRMMDVMLSIKPVDDKKMAVTPTMKVAKKIGKSKVTSKKSTRKTNKPCRRRLRGISNLTGHEQLDKHVGNINGFSNFLG